MTHASGTRLSLLERARLRDERAWIELVDLYSPLVTGWCQRSNVGPESTADCIQEVFSSVARSLDTFQAPGTTGAFRGWLWTITRNKLRDAARRGARHGNAVGGSNALAKLQLIADVVTIPDDEPSMTADLNALMRRALNQIESSFETKTWQAFWRTAIDGLPTVVVSAELNLSCASIRQARSRVMHRLHQQLGDLM